MENPKNCYDCEFCLDKDSRFCSCGLTLYAETFTSMILIDPRTGVENPCPLKTGEITLEAHERYKEALEKRGIKK